MSKNRNPNIKINKADKFRQRHKKKSIFLTKTVHIIQKKRIRTKAKDFERVHLLQKITSIFTRDATKSPDKILLLLFVFFIVFGLVMVLDTSSVFSQRDPHFHNAYHFLILQAVWVIIGLIGFFIAYFMDYKIIKKFVLALYIITLILLFMTLFTNSINGAKSWLTLGGLNLQPSEIAKLTFVLYISGILANSRVKKNATNKEFILNDFLPFLLLFLLVVVFVIVGKDLGTTIIISSVALFMYFYKSTTKREYIAFFTLFVFVIVGGIGMITLESYRGDRVKVYVNALTKDTIVDEQGSGYQMKQILLALGTGGLTGVGFTNSLQKYDLVETTAATDSVIAIVAEELGFIGAVSVLLLFLIFLFRGLKIASYTEDNYGRTVAVGLTAWIGMQVFLHVASNVVVTPLTGVPLPFLSYGGSSLLPAMAATGILLNISKH